MERRTFMRRAALLGTGACFPVAQAIAAERPTVKEQLSAIEMRVGGRLGVAALDTGTGNRIDYRSDDRFPMCSTFKFLAVAAVLKKIDAGEDRLDRRVPYGASDLLDNAPVTKAHVAEGALALSALCEAAIEYSDNTAANLLLQAIGGPPGFTHFARSLGDPATRLDRTELSLNTAIPGDLRDTTSPAAILDDMKSLLLGDVLSSGSRRRLELWLLGNKTGDSRIRAGVPPAWRVGDKTGTGQNGTTNDIAIIGPPDSPPILVAAYLTETAAPADARNGAHAEIGRIVAQGF